VSDIAVEATGITRIFNADGKTVTALRNVSFQAETGQITMLLGPDGAGKTTFIRLCAGLLSPSSGCLRVLGMDAVKDPEMIQASVSYMPQKFGLYEDLTVRENMDLYADLYGIDSNERETRFQDLLAMTDMSRFTERRAGKLSGGMKQKLALSCTLLSNPRLLLLDEPCVGVDPLSRRDLWKIITSMVARNRMTVIVSTAYLDETAFAGRVYLFNEGEILGNLTPEELREKARGKTYSLSPGSIHPRIVQSRLIERADLSDAVPLSGTISIVSRDGRVPEDLARAVPREPGAEDGFMCLFREKAGVGVSFAEQVPEGITGYPDNPENIIEVRDLLKTFGNFTAVNHTSFTVRKGEIFGLLGPNGAGKTTTFRMLCGLIPASGGVLRVAGYDLHTARDEARRRIGYVAQKFSLYQDLTVRENLEFFGRVYGLHGKRLREQMAKALEEFSLGDVIDKRSGELPGGFKQRLSMAAGTMHEPEILFLDEPTSGIDPLARRVFWHRITSLAAEGTTIVITTHFLEEAEYCNRIMIQDAGTMIALGTPGEVRASGGETPGHPLSMEQVFINIVMASREKNR